MWVNNELKCEFKTSSFKYFILISADSEYNYYLGIDKDSKTPDSNYILRSKVII